MSETLRSHGADEQAGPSGLAQQLLTQAKSDGLELADGVELVGPSGLLNQLTATVLGSVPGFVVVENSAGERFVEVLSIASAVRSR